MVVGGLFLVAAMVVLLTHRNADRVWEGEVSAKGPVADSGPSLDRGGSRKAGVLVAAPGSRSRARAGSAVLPTRNNPSSAAIQSARADFPDFKAVGYAGTNPVTEGIHRVVVRSPDGDRKMLEFWAGPERVFAGGTPASR